MKHRTQILLEDSQYQALREEAARLKVSFSSLIRKGIDRLLSARRSRKASRRDLQAFAGVIKKKQSPLTNAEIDRIVYGLDSR